jgi:hypothetical protein
LTEDQSGANGATLPGKTPSPPSRTSVTVSAQNRDMGTIGRKITFDGQVVGRIGAHVAEHNRSVRLYWPIRAEPRSRRIGSYG